MNYLPDFGWGDVLPKGKYKGMTVNDAVNADGKDAVLHLLRSGVPLTDDVISEFRIHRTSHEPVYVQYIIDPEERAKNKDHKVYKKETLSKEKILKEILTLEKETPDAVDYKETSEDVDLIAAAETVIDESTVEYNG